MREINDLSQLDFKNWGDISYKGKKISSFGGRVYFQYDEKTGKLYYEKIKGFERIRRPFSSDAAKRSKAHFRKYLKDKSVVPMDVEKHGFCKLVNEKLETLRQQKAMFFTSVGSKSEEELIALFEQGLLDVNVVKEGTYLNLRTNALWEACREGKFKLAAHLIEKGADINAKPRRFGDTLFHLLLRNNELEFASSLIDRGLDLHARSSEDQTPLHLVIHNYDAKSSDTKPIIKRILEESSEIDAKDEKGLTPLCYACRTGDLEIVQLLVEAGADLNVEGKAGQTPLKLAIQKGNLDVVQCLTEKMSAIDGDQPLHEAVASGHEKIARFLLSRVDVNAVDNSGQTALDRLFDAYDRAVTTATKEIHLKRAQQKLLSIGKLLLEVGADPNIAPNFGSPLLHRVVEHGQEEFMELLLSYPITDVDREDLHGPTTSLHIAVDRGREEMLASLIRHGADMTLLDKKDRTPLEIAQLRHYTATMYQPEKVDTYSRIIDLLKESAS